MPCLPPTPPCAWPGSQLKQEDRQLAFHRSGQAGGGEAAEEMEVEVEVVEVGPLAEAAQEGAAPDEDEVPVLDPVVWGGPEAAAEEEGEGPWGGRAGVQQRRQQERQERQGSRTEAALRSRAENQARSGSNPAALPAA